MGSAPKDLERQKSASGLDEAVERYRKGDESAFVEFYKELAPALYAFAVRLLGSKQDGADALQDLWCKVFKREAQWTAGATTTTWLFVTLRNHCFDRLRRRRSRLTFEPPAEEESMEVLLGEVALADWYAKWGSVAGDSLFREALGECVLQVPPIYRVLLLYMFDGWSYSEMASAEGISESQVKGRLHRAREQLKEHLAQHGYEPDAATENNKGVSGHD